MPFSHTYRHAPRLCPVCGKQLDASSGEDDAGPPEPGDAAIVCAYCTAFLLLDKDGSLRVMTAEDVAGLDDHIRNLMLRLRRTFKAFNKTQTNQPKKGN